MLSPYHSGTPFATFAQLLPFARYTESSKPSQLQEPHLSQYESQFEENLYNLRREKLAQIAAIARAQNAALTESEAKYPNTFRFTHTVPELRAIGDPLTTEQLETAKIEAAVAGRIMA